MLFNWYCEILLSINWNLRTKYTQLLLSTCKTSKHILYATRHSKRSYILSISVTDNINNFLIGILKIMVALFILLIDNFLFFLGKRTKILEQRLH